jgi:monoterpene epsilon-lactone hydrolase
MPSIAYHLLKLSLRQVQKITSNKPEHIQKRRLLVDSVSKMIPNASKTTFEAVKIGNLNAEWVRPKQADNNTIILYFHGGAYVFGSLDSHRHLVSHIAKASQCLALHVGYALAPEAPFPAALNDATAAYDWLKSNHPKAKIVIMGDSAGGGLSLALMHKLKSENRELPNLAVLIAPLVDQTGTSETIKSLGKNDVILSAEMLTESTKMYTNDVKSPLVSPLFGDFYGFPSTLIHVGTHDILLDDSISLHKKMQIENVRVKITIQESMIHVWHFFVGILPEARKSINEIAAYIQSTK